MLNGDISNKMPVVIGIRCENCLFTYKDNNVGDKIMNKIFGKIKRAEVNEKVLSLANYLYRNTEMSVSLIIDKENYSENVEEFLKDFPCNQIGQVLTNISEITMMLNTGVLTYYLDDDPLRLSLVNSKYAMTTDEFNKILKRQVVR